MGRYYRCVCVMLVLLAAMSFGGGLGDVIYTALVLCPNLANFCPASVAAVMTWVAPGIWASVIVMATGLVGISYGKNPIRWRTTFVALSLLSAVFLTPIIIVINAVEIYFVIADTPGPQATNFNDFTNSYYIKFILPLVVGVLGVIEFFICAGLLIYICAQPPKMDDETEVMVTPAKKSKTKTDVITTDTPVTPRPAPLNGPSSAVNGPGLGYYYPTRIYELPARTPAMPGRLPGGPAYPYPYTSRSSPYGPYGPYPYYG